jgi:protein-tyrosine-phosphatase
MQPPQVLHLLANPVRWSVVQALRASDLKVQELVAGIDQPYNLVSYHLKLLRDGGLVTLRKSDADGRDLYYHLEFEKLLTDYTAAGRSLHGQPALSPAVNHRPLRVVFLCTHNSARSQMAEALLRTLGGSAYWVSSAGSSPRPVHPEAVRTLAERGIDIQNHQSRHLSEFADQPVDLAVTVCDRVREECAQWSFCQENIHWSIPDPVAIPAGEAQRRAFAAVAKELESRIRRVILNESYNLA